MSERKRYHLNVVGPFYVEHGCCTLCGVPESEAPDLFGSDASQCYVKRQPSTPEELGRMLQALRVQELGCVRYAGADPNILETIRRWHDLPIVDALDTSTSPTETRDVLPAIGQHDAADVSWWVRMRAWFAAGRRH